jgi:hypothetical protein
MEYRLSFGRTLSAPLQIISLSGYTGLRWAALIAAQGIVFRLPATRCHKTKRMKVGF